MDETIEIAPLTLANYQLRLPAFEGPLDLLLRLIERSQLAITDVSLTTVTSQFLEIIQEMRETTPAETIAEFAAVGTRLTLLKSRSLLPRPPRSEDEEAPQSDLTIELAEYKRLKEIAIQLGERFASGYSLFAPATRLPVSIPTEPKDVRLVPYEANVLLRSLRRRLTTVPRPIQMIRQRKIVSIREMIDRVIHLTSFRKAISFTTLTAEYQTRTEVATAFLAVLVLVRRRSLLAAQGDLFSEITLEPQNAEEAAADDLDEFIN
ncbi:MAG TPA: segregation/condensation protein A [Thermomicrobiales bacterium]|nr:segregation/condensation protein A [Thermomicrobiales bacterium]